MPQMQREQRATAEARAAAALAARERAERDAEALQQLVQEGQFGEPVEREDEANLPQAPAPPAAAPAPAVGRPVALVVDPKNPRTPREDTDRIYQWVGRGREPGHEEMVHWVKMGFSFTTKCAGGWYWFRKPWHAADVYHYKHNPRSIAEDVDHKYQWTSNVANLDDGWNYCGQDREGQRWYRRPWPKPDVHNPRRPEDDTGLKFAWSVLASGGDNMEMIRGDWEYAGKGPQNGTNLWRKRRRVAGVLPPDAADPEARHEVEGARRHVRQRLAPDPLLQLRQATGRPPPPSDDDE